MKINPKISPPSFVGKNTSPTSNHSRKVCEKLLMTWKSVRYLNASNQRNPRFVGWIVKKNPKSTQRSNNDDVLAVEKQFIYKTRFGAK